jgi:peroxiredoxin
MISRMHVRPALPALCATLLLASPASVAPLCSIVALGLLGSPASSASAKRSLNGTPAPDLVLKGLDGKNLRLSEFRGQVVLVNFWARWAGDSRAEMPALDRINATYGRSGVVVLGVSMDEDLQRARQFASSMHVTYPMLFDSGERIGRAYDIDNLPFTVLIDRSGTIRFSNAGFKDSDEQALVEHIRELLRE